MPKITGTSKAALDAKPLGELQEMARTIWGTVPNVRKPELVKRIAEHHAK